MSGYISVRNFKDLQHYKGRNPVWIRLYTRVLDDYEFGCLQDASKWLAVGLWILASKHDNRIPNDPKWIASKLGLSEDLNLEPLVVAGFITLEDCEQDASSVLAERYQDASLARGRALVSSSSKKKASKKKEGDVTESGIFFELARERYPKRPGVSWSDARVQWDARVKQGVEPRDLLAGVDAYAAYTARSGTEPTFVKHPATFFGKKGRHWETEYGEQQTPQTDRAVIVEDIIRILKGPYGSWLWSTDTHEGAFDAIQRENPDVWARAGPVLPKLRYGPLFDLRAGPEKWLAEEIERQLGTLNGRA